MGDILVSIHGKLMGLDSAHNIIVQDPATGNGVMVVPGPSQTQAKGSAYIVLTNAQVLALNTTPITVIAAQGAGISVVPTRAIVRTDAGTAYTVGGTSDLTFRYTNGSGQQLLGQIETTGFLDQTTTQARSVIGVSSTSTTAGDVTPLANAPVVAFINAANVSGGTSPIYIKIFYDIINNGFTS